ncbi:MAG: hypothetical protein R3F14_28295 [Polyangiaceae bacterium]
MVRKLAGLNIEDFQCEYQHPAVTGKVEDVEDALIAYHDQATVPITPATKQEDPHDPDPHRKDQDKGFRLAAFDGNNDPSSPGNNLPPPQQLPPMGVGIDGPTGTVKPPLSRKTNLSSILEVIDQGLSTVDWIAVPVKEGGYEAIFWMFKDALMHKRTGRRWPCSPAEAQMACAKLQSTPSDLPGFPEPVPSKSAEHSIF